MSNSDPASDLQAMNDIPESDLQGVLDDLARQSDQFEVVGTSRQSNGLWTVTVRRKSDAGTGQPSTSESGSGPIGSGAGTNETLSLSPVGAKLIQDFESCAKAIGGGRFQAYSDPVGVLTIGWGHTNHRGRQFDSTAVWTQQECDDAFLDDMDHFEGAVKKLVKVPLNQHQFDALVSFCYNCGEGNLASSTLLGKLNAGVFAGAAAEFARWNKAKGEVLAGLTRRRAAEAKLFRGGGGEGEG